MHQRYLAAFLVSGTLFSVYWFYSGATGGLLFTILLIATLGSLIAYGLAAKTQFIEKRGMREQWRRIRYRESPSWYWLMTTFWAAEIALFSSMAAVFFGLMVTRDAAPDNFALTVAFGSLLFIYTQYRIFPELFTLFFVAVPCFTIALGYMYLNTYTSFTSADVLNAWPWLGVLLFAIILWFVSRRSEIPEGLWWFNPYWVRK